MVQEMTDVKCVNCKRVEIIVRPFYAFTHHVVCASYPELGLCLLAS